MGFNGIYPLVICYIAIEKMAIEIFEIVSLFIEHGDFP